MIVRDPTAMQAKRMVRLGWFTFGDHHYCGLHKLHQAIRSCLTERLAASTLQAGLSGSDAGHPGRIVS